MAKQDGFLPVKGTVGNLTFYKSKDGYLMRQRGGVDKNKIANDPAYQRTRENMAEFSRAGKASKLLRESLRLLLKNCADSRMIGRLTKEMVRVIRLDAINPRGLRNVIDGEAEILQGFEFNQVTPLSTSFHAVPECTIDRATGKLTVTIPEFTPQDMVAAAEGATHFRINSAGAALDFEAGVFEVDSNSSAMIPINNVPVAQVILENTLTANSTHPLFLALGIEFFIVNNGFNYPLKNSSVNALKIAKVEGL